MGGPLLASGSYTPSDVDFKAINDFLRTQEVAVAGIIDTPIEVSPLPPNNTQPFVDESISALITPPIVEEAVPGVILKVPDVNKVARVSPRDAFSKNANSVRLDPGVVFENPSDINLPEILQTPYKIKPEDTFWDINEGQSVAGKLPFMVNINKDLRNALIKEMRDELEGNESLRKEIGGFGTRNTRPFTDQLETGEFMNLNILNEFGKRKANDIGY